MLDYWFKKRTLENTSLWSALLLAPLMASVGITIISLIGLPERLQFMALSSAPILQLLTAVAISGAIAYVIALFACFMLALPFYALLKYTGGHVGIFYVLLGVISGTYFFKLISALMSFPADFQDPVIVGIAWYDQAQPGFGFLGGLVALTFFWQLVRTDAKAQTVQ